MALLMDPARLAKLKEAYRHYREDEDRRIEAEALAAEQAKQAEKEVQRARAWRAVEMARKRLAKDANQANVQESKQDQPESTRGDCGGNITDLPLLHQQPTPARCTDVGVSSPLATPSQTGNPASEANTAVQRVSEPQQAVQPICAKGGAAVMAEWLRRFFATPDTAIELRALYKSKRVVAGFFDYRHLDQMAKQALELSQSSGIKGVYFTLNPLRPELLTRHGTANQVRAVSKGESTNQADVVRRAWLFIDADPRRPAEAKGCSSTETEKQKGAAKLRSVRDYLTAMGWPAPLFCDSGNSSHLLYRIDLPVQDGGLVRRVLYALAERFDDEHVEIDRKVHDAARIDKLYGTKACKGEDTVERPHRWTAILEAPDNLQIVSRELLERGAGPTPIHPSTAAVGTRPGESGDGGTDQPLSVEQKQARARAYVAKMEPAVEGSSGDKQTYSVACRLVKDFDLSPDQALPLLREYNARCIPPWPEDDLQRKLEYADKLEGERGTLLRVWRRGRAGKAPGDEIDARTATSTGAEPFLGTVPNFVLADWKDAVPRPRPCASNGRLLRGRKRIGSGLLWLLRMEVIRQRRSIVVLPDVVMAQVVWGVGRRPANWRQQLRRWLSRWIDQLNARQLIEKFHFTVSSTCCPQCFLHANAALRHNHFVVTVAGSDPTPFPGDRNLDSAFLGVLELFGQGQGDQRVFDFIEPPDDCDEVALRLKEQIRAYKKSGRLCSVYLPIRLFGASPQMDLSYQQRQILNALPRETTRAKNSRREDKAAIVVGGAVVSSCPQISVCPFLQTGERYVGFNGNGGFRRRNLRGRGYHLIGKTGKGWLGRAGFVIAADEQAKWQTVERFLKELASLCEPFGLVAAGWHADKRQWRSLPEMVELSQTPAGRCWLDRCSLRVYTREDYLIRWRRYVADLLGFSHIPGDGDEGDAPAPLAPSAVTSAADLHLWMRRVGMTDHQLATHLGVSRSYVSRQHSGRSKWSAVFQAKVAKFITAFEESLPKGA